jgi:hypothetical protein
LCQSKVWQMNFYQKQADMSFKIVGYTWGAILFFDIMKVLPNFLSDRIMNALLAKLPI